MTEKKMTKEQLRRRLDKSVLHIDRTKDYRGCYFSDRGIRIEIEESCAIISRQSFRLVFDRYISGGYSRIYILLESVVNLAGEYDCRVVDSSGDAHMSFSKLSDSIRSADDNVGANAIVSIFTAWFDVLQSTLFLAPENPVEMFSLNAFYAFHTMVYGILSKPVDAGKSNKELWAEICDEVRGYADNIKVEYPVVVKKDDDEDSKEISMDMDVIETDFLLKTEDGSNDVE